MNSEKIKASIILEALGRPKEHVETFLTSVMNQLGTEKGITVLKKNVKEAVSVEGKEGFFTTFAEIEIETETIMHLIFVTFKYMPAHVEIIYPENLNFRNGEMGEILSELTRKLHGYDEVARVLQIEKEILEKKLKAILENSEKKQEKIEEAKPTKVKKSKKK